MCHTHTGRVYGMWEISAEKQHGMKACDDIFVSRTEGWLHGLGGRGRGAVFHCISLSLSLSPSDHSPCGTESITIAVDADANPNAASAEKRLDIPGRERRVLVR
jgi:hypothetical protein